MWLSHRCPLSLSLLPPPLTYTYALQSIYPWEHGHHDDNHHDDDDHHNHEESH